MKIEGVPFSAIDWDAVESTDHPGETGTARWRTVEAGNIRVRMVEYSPNYLADHWRSRGHVLLVLAGELTTELKGGRSIVMSAGHSYHVEEGGEPHRSRTASGALLFIVD
jgi:quercetin dioxygenase-like cupin family protein